MDDQMGCSVIEALHEKYRDDEPLENIVCVRRNLAPGGAPVRADDGELRVPPILSLNGTRITCAGDENQLREICECVTELDLTDNLLTQWTQVFEIINCIPDLNFLNLTDNKLGESGVTFTGITYPKIKRLILNGTGITWDSMLDILECFCNVEELHMTRNELTHVTSPDYSQYPSVTSLYANNNHLSDWAEVVRIGTVFPRLEHLMMIANPLSGVPDEVMEELVPSLSNLRGLNIASSSIRAWEELEKFRWFPNLLGLRIQGCPLWTETDETLRRQLAIGYLPNILRLNGSDVSGKTEERLDAERAFIRHYMDHQQKPNRYHELEERHGRLAPLADVSMTPSDDITVVIQAEGKTCLRTVKVTWTLSELKRYLVAEVLSEGACAGKKIEVYYRDAEAWTGDELMRFGDKKLHAYPVREGNTIIVELR